MLALVVELLVTSLTGAALGFEASSFFVDEGNRPRLGQGFLVIDPDALGGTDVYRSRVETLIAEMTRDRRRAAARRAPACRSPQRPRRRASDSRRRSHAQLQHAGGVTRSMTAVVTRRAALLLNVAHAIDHMFLLIFATAVAAIAVDFGFPDWEVADALRRRRVHAVRPGLAARRAPRRPVGPAADDAGVLLRHGRLGAADRRDARCVAARRRADADGRVLVDLSPGGHSDARARRAAPGARDRRQRARGKPRRRLRGRDDGPARQVRGLARGVRRARACSRSLAASPSPASCRARRRRRRRARGRPRRTTRRRSRASSWS